MGNILRKEIKLSSSILSFLFLAFAFMFFLPGYPVLCGAFFVCLGLFQSFQNAREANDIVFSALLPIAKKDVVKGKFVFSCFIELCGLALMGIIALLRMTVLSDVPAYVNNALMNANLFALAVAFVIFGLFNLIFIYGFFKTAYKFAKPFVAFIVVNFLVIGISESLHYFPGLDKLNSFGFDNIGLQLVTLFFGILVYAAITFVSYKKSCRAFEKIDL